MLDNERPVDHVVRRTALSPQRSFIVQAPAGSGKTELLTQRYLGLLALAGEPEEIVAITFTRKAAGEMRNRVLQAIRDAESGVVPIQAHKRETWELGRAVLERNHERGWKLLELPARLRIQTVDALCHALLQQMPLGAQFGNVGGMFEQDAERERIYLEAAHNTIKQLGSGTQGDEAIVRVLYHLDNNVEQFASLIAAMLTRRDQWERHIETDDPARLRQQFEGVLRGIVTDALANARTRLQDSGCADQVVQMIRIAETNLSQSDRPNRFAACRGIARLPESGTAELDRWRAIRTFLLKKNGNWRKQADVRIGFGPNSGNAKQHCKDLFDSLCEADDVELQRALLALDDLPGCSFSEPQWQVLESLLSVLPVAIEKLHQIFRERGAVDFIAVSQGALRTLEQEGRSNLRSPAVGIRHLLVDEFQDTSVMQSRLLAALTADWRDGDGRTIFLVGDPMQSIYRFRQAEVGLFIQAKQKGFGNLHPEPLALEVNFRSEPSLVEWFNQSFESVFGQLDDAAQGRVSFNKCFAAPGKQGGSAPEIRWADSDADEAQQVVQAVQQALADPSATVAILVRARTHLISIIPALRNANIRYEAVEIERLGERAAIRDLLMLTRALLHPADRLAWIAVLRAPWCGLSLADLDELCRDQTCTVWTSTSTQHALSPDGATRLSRLREVMSAVLQSRGSASLRRMVEGAWIALGGPACLRESADFKNAEDYFALLDAISAQGEPEAESVMAALNGLFAAPDVSAEARVKILTIHKAKGLEFDTVVIPGLGRAPQRDRPKLLLWEERPSSVGTELLLAPISQTGANEKDPIYRYLQKIESARKTEEDKRLLYVAVTRAKKHLCLVAKPTLNSDGTLKDNGALLKFLWDGLTVTATGREVNLQIAASEESSKIVTKDEGEHSEASAPAARPISRLRADWQLPTGPEGISWKASDTPASPDSVHHLTYDWVQDRLRHIGTVVHAMMQRISHEGPERWDDQRIEASRPLIRTALKSRGLDESELNEASAEVVGAIRRTLRNAKGRWILSAQREAESECALSGVVDGRILHCKLDRTFVDADGTRWIIDFKTSSHEGSGRDKFLDNEQSRHAKQLETYARLMRVLEPGRRIRLGLYFPLLDGWREWEPSGY